MQIYGFDGYFPKQSCFCAYINRFMHHLHGGYFLIGYFIFFFVNIFLCITFASRKGVRCMFCSSAVYMEVFSRESTAALFKSGGLD